MKGQYPFWRPFLVLFLLGFIGVLSLTFTLGGQMDEIRALYPDLADLSPAALVSLVLGQPTAMVLVAAAVGCLLAPRVGLVSLFYEWAAFGRGIGTRLRPHLRSALLLGLLFAGAALAMDAAFLPAMGEAFAALTPASEQGLAQLGTGVLYGGITEEILLRWGMMSLLVWVGARLAGRRQAEPPPAVAWTAIVLAAVLFGVGHLPAVSALVPLNTAIIVRTILINALGGVIFGWLFWRRNLEAAMVAHASTHLGFFFVGLLGVF